MEGWVWDICFESAVENEREDDVEEFKKSTVLMNVWCKTSTEDGREVGK